MSLQLAAQHLAAQGRGPDKQLVHMSPREVAGLQALAMARGGSLSVNPKTGLPEAGFLDNMLPAIIGAGLAFATGGTSLALTPGMIGLGVGALQTARTGSLEKGLLAGLGAYGGAGMFGALAGAGGAAGAAGAGATGAAGAAGAAGPGMVVTNTAAPQIAAEQLAAGPGLGMADPAVGLAEQAEIQRLFAPLPGASEAAQAAGRQSLTDLMASKGVGLGPTGEIVSATPLAAPPLTTTPLAAPPLTTTPQPAIVEGLGMGDPGYTAADMNTYKSSLRPPTSAERFAAMPTKEKFTYGLAALSPALLATPKTKQPELDREQYRYAYTPGPAMPPTRSGDVGEYTYFRPQYARLAAGGPVEAMSAANIYDMQNARGGVSDMGIDNSTGMQRMAEGGLSGYKGYGQPEENKYTYDPVKQQYGKVAPSPVALAALEAALPFVDTRGYGGGEMGGGPVSPTSGGAYSGVTSASFDAANMGEGSLASGGGPSGGSDAAGALGYGSGGYEGGGEGSGGYYAKGGGISDLGDYSDGGRLLKGPGDGVSDSIPAMIGRKQPARLADGEFVVPARIVSELGNGSTNAGARKLYAMMDRIQRARGKTVGKGKVAKNSKAEKYLPA